MNKCHQHCLHLCIIQHCLCYFRRSLFLRDGGFSVRQVKSLEKVWSELVRGVKNIQNLCMNNSHILNSASEQMFHRRFS